MESMAIWDPYLPMMAQLPENLEMRLMLETLASILEWQHRWHFSRSVVGRIVFLETYMGRENMLWNFLLRPRLSLNVGQKTGRGNSRGTLRNKSLGVIVTLFV